MRHLYGVVLFAFAIAASRPWSANASPNVPLDDPSYVELARPRALGRIPLHAGGVRPLTEAALVGGELPALTRAGRSESAA
jgi:hypothetical protein